MLDTHAFLWFITGDPKLSATAEQAIRDAANSALLSIASVWEIAIKVNQQTSLTRTFALTAVFSHPTNATSVRM
ncbi:MAG TPA: PIN domain-containing protein [Longimicrobium sp.]|nr:PIN domain-containing protein [Longimicrobium sp.]